MKPSVCSHKKGTFEVSYTLKRGFSIVLRSVLGPHKIVHVLHLIWACSQTAAGPKSQLKTRSDYRLGVMRCNDFKSCGAYESHKASSPHAVTKRCNCRQWEAVKFLTKPFGGEILLGAVRVELEG